MEVRDAKRDAWLEDLAALWSRGVRDKHHMAEALGMEVKSLDRRITRMRHLGLLPPAVIGSNTFDPLGKLPRSLHQSAYPSTAKR